MDVQEGVTLQTQQDLVLKVDTEPMERNVNSQRKKKRRKMFKQ
jgi:hypothetical protein